MKSHPICWYQQTLPRNKYPHDTQRRPELTKQAAFRLTWVGAIIICLPLTDHECLRPCSVAYEVKSIEVEERGGGRLVPNRTDCVLIGVICLLMASAGCKSKPLKPLQKLEQAQGCKTVEEVERILGSPIDVVEFVDTIRVDPEIRGEPEKGELVEIASRGRTLRFYQPEGPRGSTYMVSAENVKVLSVSVASDDWTAVHNREKRASESSDEPE